MDQIELIRLHAQNTLSVMPNHVDALDKMVLLAEIEQLRAYITDLEDQLYNHCFD